MENNNILNKKRAVIYYRVSTKEQVDEGNSLITQERKCKEYVVSKGYELARLFSEQGESAKTSDRTELQKLLAYCADKKNAISVIVIYKIDRLSRNTYDYATLKAFFKKHGIEIKSVSENLEDSPTGNLMETMLSGFAQFDNDVRAERCAGGMKEAMREGRYVWMAPVGYENVKIGDKATIAPSHMAGIVKETFEIVAKGMHHTEDVRKMMTEKGLVNKTGKTFCKAYFYKLLRNRVYIGQIEKFGEKHKGLYEPIISEDIFNQVQRVLENRGKKMKQYKLDSEDFPLRRFIFSPEGKSLTGSWSQGRNKKYAFYRFVTKGSNYNRDELEKKFMLELDKYKFNPDLLSKLKSILKEKLVRATANERKEVIMLKTRLQEFTEKQNSLIQKNLRGVISDDVLKLQLELIDKEVSGINSILFGMQESEQDPIELLEFAEQYLKSPSTIWKESSLEKKLKLQWFEFPSGLIFDGEKFRTTEIASVFKAKDAFEASLSTKVDSRRFELLTFRLQSDCSTI